MKRLILILSLLTLITITVTAQTTKLTYEQKKAQKLVDSKAFSAFKLTGEQKAKVVLILATQIKQIDSLESATTSITAAQIAMKMKKLDIENISDNEIIAILNEDQAKAYDKYVEERTNKEYQAATPLPATKQPMVIRQEMIAVPAGSPPPSSGTRRVN